MSMPRGTVDKRFRAASALSTAVDQLQLAIYALRGAVGYLHLGTREVRAKIADAEQECARANALISQIEETQP